MVRPLGRGFYAATYIAQRGRLGRQVVLKVAPKAIYELFGKDFEAEARLHNEVAQASQHLVPIEDYLDSQVTFGDTTLDCHVAVLQYVEGPTLDEFIQDPSSRSAPTAAQIAIDLFRLLDELERREAYHNDLHAGNIVVSRLTAQTARAEAVDPSIRLVAIDLGSLGGESKSDAQAGRMGDLALVGRHLRSLVGGLLGEPDHTTDRDYRLAALLEEIALSISADAPRQRTPSFDDIIDQIRQAFAYANSPWLEQGELRTFAQSYNAQTLHPWYVPYLLVDPDGRWTARLAQPGPLVVTGMRGCGKTMLLRALQFHARASFHNLRVGGASAEGGAEAILSGLADDGYVGLYVSCNRLLDSLSNAGQPLHEPYARLFVAYAREGLRAIRHLRELDRTSATPQTVVPAWLPTIGQVLAQHLRGGEGLAEISSELDLEHELQRILFSLDRGEGTYGLSMHPSNAFNNLADALRSSAEIWRNAPVFFLLDDVSTRHLDEVSIRDLVSQLLFSSESCAFKITTETQTLELVLRSPGMVEPARADRDYARFDLGAEVNEQLSKSGERFIADVLLRRAERHRGHPTNVSPAQLLGDVSLEQIARKLGSSKKTTAAKQAYHGLSALAAICVGDIGDVIHIYEDMLKNWDGRAVPISPATQSASFNGYCNRRLYHLSRRRTRVEAFGPLKDFALSFAEASRDLLLQSHRDMQAGREHRLRQYTKLHVSLNTGNPTRRFEQLRELVDAGVFVLEGGADAPRTKARGSDPIQQFILTYRKLFGLSNFIGLSDRDRFELSGPSLEEWLDHPERGREILTRNLSGSSTPVGGGGNEEERLEEASIEEASDSGRTEQLSLTVPATPSPQPKAEPTELQRVPTVKSVRLKDLLGEDLTFVLGLGFEERTLASARRVLATLRPGRAVAIQYEEAGQRDAMLRMLDETGVEVELQPYGLPADRWLKDVRGPLLVDVTGLAKPVIFRAVRDGLRQSGRVLIVHTEAERYYPLDDEINAVFHAEQSDDPYRRLEAMEGVWSGEAGPYAFDSLLESETDDTRRRVLLAASSPKHQRLLSLLEERDYDAVEIAVPAGDSPRAALARFAAEVASQHADRATLHRLQSNDLAGTVNWALRVYQENYVDEGFAVEIGLTGSKLQGAALSAISVVRRVARVWYVRPSQFDPARFTSGVGPTKVFEIAIDEGSSLT